jgi:hypothetical protein
MPGDSLHPIHFFPLAAMYSGSLFCGDFRDGDGWTALPKGVTCSECLRRVGAFTMAPEAASGLAEQQRGQSEAQ